MWQLDKYGYMDFYDILLPPFYIAIILFVANYIRRQGIKTSKDYAYLMPAICTKIFGSIFFTLFYVYYYGGGDNTNYFITGRSIIDLLAHYPDFIFEVFVLKPEQNYLVYYFDPSIELPIFWSKDDYAFFVSKIVCLIEIVCFKSMLTTAIVLGIVCFTGIWKLFRILTLEFPHLRKEMAISVFFVPSIIFWTSGILKDTLILSAICWYVHGFYYFFIKRQFRWYYLFSMVVAAYFQLSIKPYVLFALLPGSLVWLSINLLARYNSSTFKTVLTVLLIAFGAGLGYLFLNLMSDNLGIYSLDSVIVRAGEVQNDLKQSYYGGKTFDIGTYDQTISGILGVAHKAIFAGLFRPTLLDAQNLVMLISALENTFVMLFLLRVLLKYKVHKIFRAFNYSSFLTFMFLFSIFFSFSVGLSIANFGSLVRLKSPAIPFFMASLFIMQDYAVLLKKKKLL